MLTRRGGRWHVSTVTNLLDRLGLREGSATATGGRRMTLVVRVLEDGDQGLLGGVAPGVFDLDVDPRLADAFLRDPRHHLVAAIADDRIVGFVSALDYWHPDKPRELWINEVGVTSAWRLEASEHN